MSKHSSVDYVVFGRGEYALPQLLRSIEGKEDLDSVGNVICVSKTGELWKSRFIYPAMPLCDIPFPKIDLIDKEAGECIRYIRQNYGLGCPFRCPFCTIQTNNRKVEYFPIPRVIEEIKAYRAHLGEHHNIYFGDETFTVNPRRTLEICRALKELDNVNYDIQTRVDCIKSANVLKALRESGCRWVEIGIESLNQETSDIFKQKTSLFAIKEKLKMLRDEGLAACSFIINGFPNQTLKDMRCSIDLVCELLEEKLLHASYFFGLVPYPGSLLYHNPEKYGIHIKHHDYRYYNEDMEPVYDTQYATSQEIFEVLQEGVRKISCVMLEDPYLGLVEDHEEKHYGSFWNESHI